MAACPKIVMPPGQQHRCVPPAFLSLQLLFTTVLYSNVRQGLGNNFAENAGPQAALKLIDNEDLQSETSAKVRDGGNDINTIQSRDTRPELFEKSDNPTVSRSEPGSGTGGNQAQNASVNSLGTLIWSFSKFIQSLLKSKARDRGQVDSQEGHPPNMVHEENNNSSASGNGGSNGKVPEQITATGIGVSNAVKTLTAGQAIASDAIKDTAEDQDHKKDSEMGASDIQNRVKKPVEGLGKIQDKEKAENNPSVEEHHATQSSEAKKTVSGESSAGSDTKDVPNEGKDLNRVGETGSQTAQDALRENHESGQRRRAEAGDITQSSENTPEEKQRTKNPTASSNLGEPGDNSEVHVNSDGKSGGDLAPRQPGPTVITRRKQTNVREVTIVNFVIWNLGKAAGVKTIGLRRKVISSKLTISANRIQGTRFSQQHKNRVQPDHGSYQIYRGVIMNGRVLSFGELRPKAYGGFREVRILDARLAVALFCQRRYAQRIHIALQVQCRMWRRQYRRLFYQYQKLNGAPRNNRGIYEASGRFRTNKGAHRTEDEDAPSAGEAEAGGVGRRRGLNNLAERSGMDKEKLAPSLARAAAPS